MKTIQTAALTIFWIACLTQLNKAHAQDSLRIAKVRAVRYYVQWQSELALRTSLEGVVQAYGLALDSTKQALRIAKIKAVKYYYDLRAKSKQVAELDSTVRIANSVIDSLSFVSRTAKILAVRQSAALDDCRSQIVNLDRERTAQVNTERQFANDLQIELGLVRQQRNKRLWVGMGIGAGGVGIALALVLILVK